MVFALIVSLITGSTSTVNAASSELSGYTVDGMTPLGTTVNLFDYYNYVDSNNVIAGTNTTTDGQASSYYLSDYYNNSDTSYINSEHQLVFGVGTGPGSLNSWTGNASVRSGMVANTLSDGYPALTDNNSITVDSNSTKLTSESLAYLFDDSEVSGKISYNNVDGLFQINDDGYYYFNSQSNYAEYDEDTNSFVLYDTWGVAHAGVSPDGQFFPFTPASDVFTVENGELTQNGIASRNAKINHYLGLSMSTRFVQENEGHVDASDNAKEMTYEFKGDDDVWIYIDGVLVGDLGGIHDASSVSINFATGVVVINKDTNYETTTSLYELYVAAGLVNTTAWQEVTVNGETYTIFDDDTYHELDFFYLERGNTDSNLYLMFNLITVPENQIIKLDEDGNAVKGAEFALYVANVSKDSDGNVTLTKASDDPLWTGTTDSNGELILIDSQNKLINFTTLYEKNEYVYYILEETSAPSGYQTAEPMWLHYVVASAGNVTAGLLETLNHFETGSYAQAKLHVTAPGYLDNSGNGLLDYNGNSINGAYDTSGNLKGSIFAVVLKRAGTGTIANDTWYPVSGNVTDGFTLGDAVKINGVISNDMLAAAHQFTMGANGLYQLELDDLPGEIDSYYYIISAQGGNVEEAQYTVAYYYMDENGNPTLLQDDQFEREYATIFYISDIQNELIVQKVDQDGNAVNGAEFTLYNADDVTVNTDGTYTISTDANAVATLTTSTLTEDNDGIDLEGGGIFSYLANGSYYVVETKAPEGYAINSEVIKVYVDNTGVYANAGEVDDGVDVILSVDSLVKTMSQFATNDEIDQTLAYIKAQLSVYNSTSWITADNIPSSFTNSGDAVALHYSETDVNEYVATDSNASYPIVVDSGWSSINISQNTELLKTLNVNYTELENSLNNLYSMNTIVRVTDNKVADLAITKTVDVKEGLESVLSSLQDIDFTFNVQLLDPDGNALEGTYAVEIYDENSNLVDNTSITITNGSGTITLKDGQTAIIKDVIIGSTYIIQEEEANKNYDTSITVDYDTDASIGVVEDETLKNLIDPDEVVGYTGTVTGIVDDVDNTETEDIEIITVNYTNVYDAISKEVDITFDPDSSTSNNASGTTVGVGDVLTYNIEWNNYKKETADVTVKDIIPEGTTYVYGSVTNTGNLKFYNADDEEITVTQDNVSSVSYLVWTFNDVEAGTSGTVSFDVIVNDTAVDNQGNEISNLAEIVVGDDPVVTNTVTNTVPEKTVTDADDNDIDGSYPYIVTPTSDNDTGYRLNYTIYYTNTESDTATVTITDELSEYVTYISGSSYNQNGTNAEPTTSTDNGTTTLTWVIEDVEAGASGYVTFRVAVNADVVSTIENTGTVTIGDNPAVSTNTVTNTVPEPVKDVLDTNGTRIDGEKVAVGDVLTYTIDYTNTSDETEEVVITDATPTGTTYVADSASATVTDANGDQVDKNVTIDDTDTNITGTVSLDAGETVQAVFKVTVNEGTEGTSINNDATVVANDYEIKTNTITNDIPGDPVKDVTDDSGTSIDGDKVAVEDVLTYTIDYTNTSDETEEVVITDAAPTGTTYVVDSAKVYVEEIEVTNDDAVKVEDGTIIWTVSLDAGESVRAVFKVTVNENTTGTSINNDATVVANDYEIKTNTVTNDVPEDPVKDVTDDSGTSIDGDKVAVGDELTYTIDYTNTSDETETVVITDAAPTGTTYVDGSAKVYVEGTEVTTDGAVKVEDGTITWTVILDADESVQAIFKVTVNEETEGTSINNYATVVANDYEIKTNTVTNDIPEDPTTPTETTTADIQAKKVLENKDLTEEFSFTLKDSAGNEIETVSNDEDGNISFTTLDNLKVGEYSYTIIENIPDGVDENNTLNGIQYDSSIWNVKVVVSVGETTDALVSHVTYAKGDNEYGDSIATFTNTYSASPITDTITATKTLTGKELAEGEFTFKLTGLENAPLPEGYDSAGVTNDDTGSISFGTITFEEKGTYVYEITEVNNNQTGYTYDESTYTVTYVVEDDGNGSLGITSKTITVNDEEVNSIVFENSYQPLEVSTDTTIGGTKDINIIDGTFELKAGQFTFVLTDIDTGEEAQTVQNDDNGNYSFNALTFTEAGEYTYKVTESSSNITGISDDSNYYTITFNVEDYDGQLVITETTITDASENTVDSLGSLNFTNTYNPTEITYSITGIKVISNTDSATNRKVKEGEFTFELTAEDEAPLPETTVVTNDANGNISFGEMTFTQTGTYTYYVKEIKGNDNTISYDETIYTIVITITDVDGNLSASADVANEDIIFTNSYTPTEVVVGPSGKVNISGSKSYTDKDGNALDITDGQFSFKLIDSNDETVSTAKVNSDGTFVFDDITYDTVGTYRYTVKEVNNISYDGITYDTTVYDVVVNVTEDTNENALVATVTYMLDGENVETMSFVNSYSTTPATIHLVGTKVYTGATLTDDQFTYQLLDSDNNVIITATNNADGTIDFGTLTYETIGTYTYTISEVNDEQENVTYDDSIYKVEVVVSDNGLGELVAHISYSVDDEEKATVIFENTYNEVTETPEDPTTPSETTTTVEETPSTPTETTTTEVKTGDDSSYELWIGMMGLALIGLGYIYYERKHYNM